LGIAVYVRNDPVNMVDPDGQRPRITKIFPIIGVIWQVENNGELYFMVPSFGIMG
jgi:hypothetical protein